MKFIGLLFVFSMMSITSFAQQKTNYETKSVVVEFALVEAAILADLQPKSQTQITVKVNDLRSPLNPFSYAEQYTSNNVVYAINFTLNSEHTFTCQFNMRRDVNAIIIDTCSADETEGRIHTLIFFEYEEIGLSYASISKSF